jgi:hypothetical protein
VKYLGILVVAVLFVAWMAAALGALYGTYWTFAGRLLYAVAWQVACVMTTALFFDRVPE